MNAAATSIDAGRSPAPFFWTRINWDREGSRIAEFSNGATALYFQLKACAWTRNGIPTDNETFCRILKHRCRIGWKKFLKLWPEIQDCFIERDGRMYNREDEEERARNADISGKRKEAGSLGAHRRWIPGVPTPAESVNENGNCHSAPMANAPLDNNNKSREIFTEEELQHQHPPRPLLVEEEDASQCFQSHKENKSENGTDRAGGNPNGNGNNVAIEPPESSHGNDNGNCHNGFIQNKELSDEEYKNFCSYCADPSSHPALIPFATPGRKLAEKIKFKFAGIPIWTLPKFQKQQSAAMWMSDYVSAEQMRDEIQRLQYAREHPEQFIKKPAATETLEAKVLAAMIRRKAAV